jgi:predicted Zn-dependent protease
MRTVKKMIDDEEREDVRLSFKKLTTAEVASVKELKIRVAYEKE